MGAKLNGRGWPEAACLLSGARRAEADVDAAQGRW